MTEQEKQETNRLLKEHVLLYADFEIVKEENQRLRKALEEIANGEPLYSYDMRKIAHQALDTE